MRTRRTSTTAFWPVARRQRDPPTDVHVPQRQQASAGDHLQHPMWEPWQPVSAAAQHHGHEVTLPSPSAYHTTMHRESFKRPPLTPRPEPPPVTSPEPKLFQGNTTSRTSFQWPRPEDYAAAAPPAPSSLPAAPYPPAWPVVSFHGHVDAVERAVHNSAIEMEEARAWRRLAKVVPERLTYHGEDELRATGKPPLTRALGGYPTRGCTPPPARAAAQRSSGYGHGARRATAPPKITWRQHAPGPRVSRDRPPPPREAAVATGAHTRSRADDFTGSVVLGEENLPEPQAAMHPKVRDKRQPHTLMSSAEWKRVLRERARMSMPGACREAAAGGCRALGQGAYVRAATRVAPTGAGNEPLPIGVVARPRSGAHRLATWGSSKAMAYR